MIETLVSVFPAGAGVIPTNHERALTGNRVSRRRGGDPMVHYIIGEEVLVFPAGAGVIPLVYFPVSRSRSVSRRRGGDPEYSFCRRLFNQCFPQARG